MQTSLDGRQGDTKARALVDRERMTDGKNKNEQDTNPEEQPEDHQHAAQAPQKRSEKSPKLMMGMQTKMFRTGAEMGPGPGPAD